MTEPFAALGEPLDELLSQIDPESAGSLKDFAASVPSPLPPIAVPLFVWLQAGTSGPISSLGVAGPGDIFLTVRAVCLTDLIQIACIQKAMAPLVAIEPRTGVLLELAEPPVATSRFDVLVLPANDEHRPIPTVAHVVRGARDGGHLMANALAIAPAEEVMGGCDVAALRTDLRRHESFRAIVEVTRETEAFVVVERCDPRPELVQLVLLSDGRVVKAGVWDDPVILQGKTSVLSIPDLPAGTSQAIVISLEEDRSRDAIVTHSWRVR